MSMDIADLNRVFLPHAFEEVARAKDQNVRFAYYTTADTAIKLLRSKEMWLRNARLMNDFSEVEHGIKCYEEVLHGKVGDELFDLLDDIHDGVSGHLLSWLDQSRERITQGTYVVCVSEHDPSEDQLGRLSMWRAYGGKSGVALVFSTDALLGDREQLGAFSGPVVYGGIEEIEASLRRVIGNVRANLPALRVTDKVSLIQSLLQMILVGCFYTKNPGFKEEKEWRVIANPSFSDAKKLTASVESVEGLPQPVMKIPLVDGPNVTGLEVSQILERVIVGPCTNSSLVRQAIEMTFIQLGYAEPAPPVICSNIPLRL